MALDNNWFSEVYDDDGCAFSLKVSELLHEEQTEYQKIAIYQTEGFGRLMVIDGCTMLTDRDNFIYHEMMTHPVLLSHPGPETVAIIGGGDCGTLREVLKHDCVKHATQIDIDERVTRLSEEYFPQLCESNNDPRAELLFIDGIKWMQDREPGSLDIIIIDSTDPVGPAEGLFQGEFYRTCLRALRPGGLLVQQSESPLLHDQTIIPGMHRELRAAGFVDTATLLYPLPIYPSGWWSATLAGCSEFPRTALRTDDAEALPASYYSPEIHNAAYALPPFLKNAIES